MAPNTSDDAALRMSVFMGRDWGLARSDDVQWLVDLYGKCEPEDRSTILYFFDASFDMGKVEHRNAVLSLPRSHPLHADRISGWVDPIQLGSPEAIEAKE